MTVQLLPHQLEASEKLANGRILWGGVGTGKSITAVHYYITREAPRDVYVITTAKKRDSLDWDKEFAKFGVGTRSGATVAGVLTVDSWNNLHRFSEVTDAFFIFDEQRLVGSGEWTKNFLKLVRRNRWILLTATPGDTWLDYVPVFVANGFYKNRTEFKREHVVYNTFTKFPKVDRYISVGRLVSLRNSLLVEMPYERHTIRRTTEIPVTFNQTLFDRAVKDRWHVYENRPLKGVAELFSVMRKVVNSDSSRIQTIKTLMQEHPRLIVFYNFNYELEALRTALGTAQSGTGAPSTPEKLSIPRESETEQTETRAHTKSSETWGLGGTEDASAVTGRSTSTTSTSSTSITTAPFELAEWNGHKHEPIPSGDRWVYLVQYVAGAEGWNCTTTDTVVFYSLPYSYKIWEQAHGRIDRLDTPYRLLNYFVLKSNSAIDKAVWGSLRTKKSFNEKKYTGAKWDQ